MKTKVPISMGGCLAYIKVYNIDRRSKFINRFLYSKRRLKKIIHSVIDDNVISKEFLLDFIEHCYKNLDKNFDNVEIDYNDNISGMVISSSDANSKVRVSTSKNVNIETIYITINSKSISLPKTINVNNECIYKGNIEGNKEIVEEVNSLLQTVVKKYMDTYIDLVLK